MGFESLFDICFAPSGGGVSYTDLLSTPGDWSESDPSVVIDPDIIYFLNTLAGSFVEIDVDLPAADYTVSFTLTGGSGGSHILKFMDGGTEIHATTAASNTNGDKEFTFTTSSAANKFRILAPNEGSNFYVSNLVITGV